MNKQKLHKILNYVKYGSMILFVFFLGYVIFVEQNNFCVTVKGLDYAVDFEDKGEHCFRSIGESNDFKLYLMDKYNIGKDKELFYTNISIT